LADDLDRAAWRGWTVTPIRLAEPVLRWFEERDFERLATPDVPVGHGVLAPDVFFSLLSGSSRSLVHLQPARRPLDARPRLHPHRLAVHHEVYALTRRGDFAPLELVLGALEAVGFDASEHDLRLRGRDAGLPFAGIDASGWSLAIDGVEIGRASWLVTVGGIPLATPALELALGLERLAVVLPEEARRGVGDSVWQRMRAWEEAELASHGLEAADLDRLATRLDLLLGESEASLDAGLALPAFRGLLEAVQVVETLEQRDPTARRGEVERRIARGIARCAAVGAARQSSEPTRYEI
jgi:glycyl-tRNA synthetase alpha chain